jgi:hypothetical protein
MKKSTLLKKQNINNKAGFTLFIALVVTGLLLAIGFSIGNIVYKQIVLSSTGKESQLAFFAADSGAECALYWDRKDASGASVADGSFATSAPIAVGFSPGLKCAGQEVSVTAREVDMEGATTTFSIDFSRVNYEQEYRACARVTVIKSGPYTQIDSRGYNTFFDPNGGDCVLSNPRILERGLQLNY